MGLVLDSSVHIWWVDAAKIVDLLDDAKTQTAVSQVKSGLLWNSSSLISLIAKMYLNNFVVVGLHAYRTQKGHASSPLSCLRCTHGGL
jgi:hypothetical protein